MMFFCCASIFLFLTLFSFLNIFNVTSFYFCDLFIRLFGFDHQALSSSMLISAAVLLSFRTISPQSSLPSSFFLLFNWRSVFGAIRFGDFRFDSFFWFIFSFWKSSISRSPFFTKIFYFGNWPFARVSEVTKKSSFCFLMKSAKKPVFTITVFLGPFWRLKCWKRGCFFECHRPPGNSSLM